MGRLLTQSKKPSSKGLSWSFKRTTPKNKKHLLPKLFEDSLTQNQNSDVNLKLQESTANLDRRTWKAKTFSPTQDLSKFGGRCSNKKVTISDLHLYNSQRKNIESRLSWASTEASESQRPSLTMLPNVKAETQKESISKRNHSKSKTLPKLCLPQEKMNVKQTKPNQEEENDRNDINQLLKNETFRRKSGLKILEDNSYFRNIKTQDDECIYKETQKEFQNKIVSMKEKLNILRSRIGEFV